MMDPKICGLHFRRTRRKLTSVRIDFSSKISQNLQMQIFLILLTAPTVKVQFRPYGIEKGIKEIIPVGTVLNTVPRPSNRNHTTAFGFRLLRKCKLSGSRQPPNRKTGKGNNTGIFFRTPILKWMVEKAG